MLLKELTIYLEKQLSDYFNKEINIKGVTSVSGGSINNTYRLDTNYLSFFIKINSASSYPNMFKKEATGLQLLRESKEIKIPKVILEEEWKDTSFLILEYIDSVTPKQNFWQDFGTKLAKLHQHTESYFGLEESNYIGSLHQQNKQHTNWTDFFIQERLQPQIKLAKDSGKMDKSIISCFENLFLKLEEIFPDEPPALLHGDLWSGNFMVDNNGDPCIMDPAVYYGHREMDIAMTQLFGGFDADFYKYYHKQYPLAEGWENRMDICNLYPLLVHVNLFGGSYLSQIQQIVKSFN